MRFQVQDGRSRPCAGRFAPKVRLRSLLDAARHQAHQHREDQHRQHHRNAAIGGISAKKKSFHDRMKHRMAVAAGPGAASGSVTRVKAPHTRTVDPGRLFEAAPSAGGVQGWRPQHHDPEAARDAGQGTADRGQARRRCAARRQPTPWRQHSILGRNKGTRDGRRITARPASGMAQPEPSRFVIHVGPAGDSAWPK
jgi:hypothetical protein